MRLFIKRLSLFILFGLLSFFIFFISINSFLNTKADFKLDSNVKSLILGHSHPERAYNDTLIPFTKNLSGAAESYLYTLAKTRKIIEQNPQIKFVLIECSNNQFSREMDNWTWGNKMSNRLHIYSPFLKTNEIKLLFTKNPKLFIEATSVLFRKSFEKILSSNYNYTNKIGGYSWNDLKLEKAPETGNQIQSEFETSLTNINFLKKIISFLNSKKIEVFLIRTPTLKAYNNNYSENQYQKIIKSEFSHTEFLDLSKYNMNYSNYGDSQHMNGQGAKEFSLWFSKLLNKNLLQKKDKQLFINNEIKARTHNKVLW